MTRPRFFLDRQHFQEDRVHFPDELGHQIRNVLRIKPGENVIVFDGSGQEFEVRIDALTPVVTGAVVGERKNQGEAVRRVVLYQALLKGDKLEMVVQKCTEMGVAGFVLVETARTVGGAPSANRMKRLEAIIREAAEQSGRGMLPELRAPLRWTEALQDAVGNGEAVLPWEGLAGDAASESLQPVSGERISVLIGPEGGFTGEEVEAARTAGVRIVNLGPRILRSETAAIATASLLLLPSI